MEASNQTLRDKPQTNNKDFRLWRRYHTFRLETNAMIVNLRFEKCAMRSARHIFTPICSLDRTRRIFVQSTTDGKGFRVARNARFRDGNARRARRADDAARRRPKPPGFEDDGDAAPSVGRNARRRAAPVRVKKNNTHSHFASLKASKTWAER